jgi:tetratricopeptide (TPR) repeat protein
MGYKLNSIILILVSLSCVAQSAEEYFSKGSFESDTHSKAIMEYSKAIKIKPDYADAYYFRGKARNELKDYNGALNDLHKAVSIRPNLIYAYIYIAKVNTKIKNYPKAIESYISFIENSDSNSRIFFQEDNNGFWYEDSLSVAGCYAEIGVLFFEMKNYDDAKTYFTKAIEIDSLYGYAFYARGFNNILLNDLQGALSDLNRSIFINPEYSSALKSRAIVKARLKDYEGAINDYLQFNNLEPENKTAYFEIGLVKRLQKKYFEAIKFFNLAIEFNNSPLSECYYQRGITKKDLNDYRGAVLDFTKALEISPNFYACYYDRGVAKSHLEDNTGAILDLTKYITQSPNGEYIKFAYSRRGLAKIGLNQKESGCLDFSKSGELGYEGAYENIKLFCN